MQFLLFFLGLGAFALVLVGGFMFRQRWQKLQQRKAFSQSLMSESLGLKAQQPLRQAVGGKSLNEQERLQRFLDRP